MRTTRGFVQNDHFGVGDQCDAHTQFTFHSLVEKKVKLSMSPSVLGRWMSYRLTGRSRVCRFYLQASDRRPFSEFLSGCRAMDAL